MHYIDTHCHLDGEEFAQDLEAVIQRAREAGCEKIFIPAIDLKSSEAALQLAQRYPGYLYPMAGLHPEEVRADWREQLVAIKAMLKAQSSLQSKAAEPSAKLKAHCGAFVSLHKQGRLRGCIGHFGEDTPLWEIVVEMARAAAFEDPRFPPLSRNELDDTDIEISVLTPMRRIQSLDEFQLHRHGIYIRKGYRSGTFLPQVADEVNWTKEEFVGHCSQDKAGLGWDGWRDAELYVYEAIVF